MRLLSPAAQSRRSTPPAPATALSARSLHNCPADGRSGTHLPTPMLPHRSACNGWAPHPRCRRRRKSPPLSDPTRKMTMAKIERVEILQVDLVPKTVRTDAIQSFATRGSSVIGLLRDHLAPRLVGRDPLDIEAIWKSLFFATHATAVGAITSLALSAIDTALWDIKCLAAGRPLWKEAGGAQGAVPV